MNNIFKKAKITYKKACDAIGEYKGDFNNLRKICCGREVSEDMFDFDWDEITITIERVLPNRAKVVGRIDVYDGGVFVGAYTADELENLGK